MATGSKKSLISQQLPLTPWKFDLAELAAKKNLESKDLLICCRLVQPCWMLTLKFKFGQASGQIIDLRLERNLACVFGERFSFEGLSSALVSSSEAMTAKVMVWAALQPLHFV